MACQLSYEEQPPVERKVGSPDQGQPLNVGARPITGDALAEEVRWEKPLADLRGKTARLEFTVRDAALFGFEFNVTRK